MKIRRLFSSAASTLDALGLRRLVAAASNLVTSGQHFSVDRHGHWVNAQPEAVFVSPTIHANHFAEVRGWVMRYSCFAYTPKVGDIILDMGTGIGEEAVIFSELIGDQGRMLAVEAHPETFRCLQQTIARSGLGNVTPLHCAIGDSDGEASITAGTENHIGNSIMQGGEIRVPQRSVQSLAAEHGLEHIDFLRANIEGAERLMVRGIGDVKIANLCVSCHDFIADETGDEAFRSKAAVRAWMESNGYRVTSQPPETANACAEDYLYASLQ